MPSQTMRKLVERRDQGICWHCGTNVDVTLHHRQNRGMGGKKVDLSDRPSNLITMCQHYNFLMESDLDAAREARAKGLKLKQTQSPVYAHIQRFDGTLWMLDDHGGMHKLEQHNLF